MTMDNPQAPQPQEPKPNSDDTPGPIERGVLGVLPAVGVVVAAGVAMSENLSVPERILGVSFALLWIAIAGMTVKAWGKPHLRELFMANPLESNVRRISRFLTRYRARFGPDLWSTLFVWSAAVVLLSALFLASTQK